MAGSTEGGFTVPLSCESRSLSVPEPVPPLFRHPVATLHLRSEKATYVSFIENQVVCDEICGGCI